MPFCGVGPISALFLVANRATVFYGRIPDKLLQKIVPSYQGNGKGKLGEMVSRTT
jgi:hypothetical protein